MDPCARKELEFWKNNVFHLNSRSSADPFRRPSRIVYSDASAVGCAAYIAIDNMPASHKNWDSLQMKQSSKWRELHYVSFALKSFADLLSGCHVKWLIDNQAVPLTVESGSMNQPTCWLVPPVSLVIKVIRHVCFCQCRGILVIPY